MARHGLDERSLMSPSGTMRYGDGQVSQHGDDRQEKPDDDHDQVAGQAGGKPPGQRLDLLDSRIGSHEPLVNRITPHRTDTSAEATRRVIP